MVSAHQISAPTSIGQVFGLRAFQVVAGPYIFREQWLLGVQGGDQSTVPLFFPAGTLDLVRFFTLPVVTAGPPPFPMDSAVASAVVCRRDRFCDVTLGEVAFAHCSIGSGREGEKERQQ
jgi:hypothetical protein